MPQILSKLAQLSVATAAVFGMGAPLAAQTTLDLKFAPPSVQLDPICVARPPDVETTRFWAAWDGAALPDWTAGDIRRDVKRLMHLDGRAWYDTITRMVDYLEKIDPKYQGQNGLLLRIEALEAAGRFDTLLQEQLVDRLAAYGEVLSGRSMTALSHFFRDGIGIARDVDRANALLVQAGYAGNAEALLTLAEFQLQGMNLPGWDVPVELAVTTAFGSLVGELNPAICDRTTRIAGEYHSGEIVTRDPQLAHDWFRFTADLGDDYAAWKVVEYHLEAEEFQKSNELLLKYLTQAADAGLPYALIELGRIYERGALVEQDLDRALSLFQKAAENGERPGLTRVALFLEIHHDAYPHLQDLRLEMLERLAALDDAPGWAFSRLAQSKIDTGGRWHEAEAIRALLEEAVRRDDLDGIVMLAQVLLRERDNGPAFDRAINLLSRAVAVNGGTSPLKALQAAFTCQAPDAPRVFEAAYWNEREAASATSILDLTAREVVGLSRDDDPLSFAIMQSHALYGRPTALAAWIKILEASDFADAELREFWDIYSNRFDLVISALAKLELELAENRDQKLAAVDLLRQEYQRSGAVAAVTLSQVLIEHLNWLGGEADADAPDPTNVRQLLNVSASAGYGQALTLLTSFARDGTGAKDIYAQYAEVIERNGDFNAMLFAARHGPREDRDRNLERAVGVMPCDYKNVMALVEVLTELDQTETIGQWLDVAQALTGENAWAMKDLARTYIERFGQDAYPAAVDLYAAASARGDLSAARDLFALLLAQGVPTYDPDRAAEMISAAVRDQDGALLAGYLGRYRRAEAAVQTELESRLDMPRIFLMAAESGDIFSMRNYGQYLQDRATGAADLAASTAWLRRAAEGGDTTAMAAYGEALAFGIGTEPDPAQASAWLQKAADQGSKKARQIVRLISLSQES